MAFYMDEWVKYCDACGEKMVLRKEPSNRYSKKNGKRFIRYIWECPNRKFFVSRHSIDKRYEATEDGQTCVDGFVM